MDQRIVLRERIPREKYPLGFPCLIGQGKDVGLMLTDPAISLRHAIIRKEGNRMWIEDLGGINGIFVNGRKIRRVSAVNPGDTIRVGHAQFTLLQSAVASPGHHLVVHAIGFSAEAALDRQKLAAIYEISAELAEYQDMRVLGKKIFSRLKDIFAHDRGYIALFEPGGALKPLLVDPEHAPVPVSPHIVERVFQNGDSLLLRDPSSDDHPAAFKGPLDRKIGSALCVPLIYHAQIYGLVYLDRMIPGAYSPPDLEFLKSIASIFAPLIENTRLLAELKSHYEDAKEVLKKTESRLIETERTAAYVRLAQAMTHELRNPLTVIGGMVRRIARMHPQQEMGETREALMSSVQRMEVVLQEMEDFVSIPSPLVRLQRIDRLVREEIQRCEKFWRCRSVSPRLTVRTPYVLVPVDPNLLRKAFSLILKEVLLTLPKGSPLPMSIDDRDNELEILMGETRSCERFCDLYDTELKSSPWSASLFLSAAHKILTDHGGTLLLDPKAHAAFPVIMRIPRSLKPEDPSISTRQA
ncbi:MAG: FHA domain-containing protein [Desulfomonilia bacterium]|jgi:signal transduction histidine kinase|uniref:FHA domain-containing protein n=1 Tax=anaerobic digester metagenome TaxID=1263854 RepID=A0A485M2Y0_9ZZZZ|nr:FHA domain-containing protein [Pseudomonadota bacterium]HON37167.1 FHA domain-containing protein [Deltaproteobacteria bacterium]HRS54953.1 FHA domain-containing protein [Desulfomonilia bacterium]HPD20075.1 FHA domain-containing protein [Deltaproteobacteria bacterium]HPX17794.1 FHA domain-containing protein [Deltaproteobacteria bacterium]